MFTRAGYRLRGARVWLVYARVQVREGRRAGWAQIIEFESGDLAWYSKDGEFLIWGLRAQFVCKVTSHWKYRSHSVSPRSSLRTRELVTTWAEE